MSDWITNEYGTITQADMENNAGIINEFFTTNGWSQNAIAAILGNMQAESGINPARWENDDIGNLSGGVGLVQWTPASDFINWVESQYALGLLPSGDYLDGNVQLLRILYEYKNGLQYGPAQGFKESFTEWATSDKNPGYLAAAFLCNYERAADTGWGAQIRRAKNAREWAIFLTGTDPGGWVPAGFIVAANKKSKERMCFL